MKAGRCNCLAKALVNSLFRTGCGATAFMAPRIDAVSAACR